jgi:oligosaccharide repeat unit polymerase
MVFLLICAILVYLVHKCFDITNLYNPFIVFFLYHTFFLFIALSYKETYAYSITIPNSTILLIISSYVTSVIGAMVATFMFNKAGIKYLRLQNIKYEGYNASYSNYAGYIILFLGFAMAIHFIIDTGGLIFFKSDMENTRITDRKGRGLITLLSISFITFGYLITLFDKRSPYFKLLLFLISSFFLLCFGNRGPMLEMALMAFVLFCIYKKIKLRFKYLVYIGISIFSLMVLFGVLRANSHHSVSDLFVAQFGWRPFVNIQNLQWIIDFFPEKMDYLYGGTMVIEAKMFLPGSNPNFGTWLKDTMELVFDGGSITTTHLGLAYINFGYVGAYLFPVFIGFLYQSVYIAFIHQENNSKLKLVFMLMAALSLGGALSSGLISVLIMNVMFVCFVACVYMFITYLLKLLGYMGKKASEADPQNYLH